MQNASQVEGCSADLPETRKEYIQIFSILNIKFSTNMVKISYRFILTCAGFSHFLRKSSLALARNSLTVGVKKTAAVSVKKTDNDRNHKM